MKVTKPEPLSSSPVFPQLGGVDGLSKSSGLSLRQKLIKIKNTFSLLYKKSLRLNLIT